MTENTQNNNYRAGYISIIGKPNAGKSTLLNKFLGQKIAAVSPRPQTTRKNQLGILTLEDQAQLIFVDTPGVHKIKHKLGEKMNEEALSTLEENDLILFLVDASTPPQEGDFIIAEAIHEANLTTPLLLVINKLDLVPDQTKLAARIQEYQALVPASQSITIAARKGLGIAELTQQIIEMLPEGPPLYPEDQITDLYERDIAADLIREAALILLKDEVPHGIAVRVDEYTEREDHGAYVEATLFVERDSQKGIVIGKGGEMLKRIGSSARNSIEAMSGRKVFLRLRVKVRKNWRNDDAFLDRFGYGKQD